MRDSFSYADYRALIGRLARTHELRRFSDVADRFPEGPVVLLRHDVDYSPAAALALAALEAESGWVSTYFLLVNGPYYNLLDPLHAAVARRLVEMGHEVGLHYDARFFAHFPANEWDALLDGQARLLAMLSGRPVRAIAMHQPALHGADPFAHRTDFLNAYGRRLRGEATYLSDSCRAWTDGAWSILTDGPLPPRLQIALHPVNWGDRDRPREQIFTDVHRRLGATIEALGDDLLRKVALHDAVRQHEARARRGAEASSDVRG